jgi:hypothetical protein
MSSSSSTLLKPFPALAVETILNILSLCDTPTLAAVCASSFELLKLAAPILYDDVVLTPAKIGLLPGRRVSDLEHSLCCARY